MSESELWRGAIFRGKDGKIRTIITQGKIKIRSCKQIGGIIVRKDFLKVAKILDSNMEIFKIFNKQYKHRQDQT